MMEAIRRSRLRTLAVIVAAMLPPLADWILKVVVRPRPFWIFYYDPEAIYFYGGLHLLRGRVPANLDNPGTPVHLLSAGLAALTGPTPLRYAAFLFAAHLLALVLTLGAILLLLRTIARDAVPLLQIAVAWTYFLAPLALERIDIWSPEAIYLPLGAAILALLWRWGDAPSPRRSAAAGAVIGLAVAAKWVFAPWAAAAVLAIAASRRFRDAAACGAAVVGGFLAVNLPFVAIGPRMLRGLGLVVANNRSAQSWTTLLATSRGWLLWVAAIVVFSIVTFQPRRFPLALFAYLTIVLTCVGAFRNPTFRYLLPASIAVVALFALAATSRPARSSVSALFAIAAALLMAKAIREDFGAHGRRIEVGESLRARIESAVPHDRVVVYGWRAPIPSFALRIMADDPRDLAAIAARYPREGHYDPWLERIFLPPGAAMWNVAVVSQADLRAFPAAQPVTRIDDFVIATAAAVSPAAVSSGTASARSDSGPAETRGWRESRGGRAAPGSR